MDEEWLVSAHLIHFHNNLFSVRRLEIYKLAQYRAINNNQTDICRKRLSTENPVIITDALTKIIARSNWISSVVENCRVD